MKLKYLLNNISSGHGCRKPSLNAKEKGESINPHTHISGMEEAAIVKTQNHKFNQNNLLFIFSIQKVEDYTNQMMKKKSTLKSYR